MLLPSWLSDPAPALTLSIPSALNQCSSGVPSGQPLLCHKEYASAAICSACSVTSIPPALKAHSISKIVTP